MAEAPQDSEPDLRDCCSIRKKCSKYVVKHLFTIASLAAAAVGTALGLTLKIYYSYSVERHDYIKLPGNLLMRMLQCITVPLIVTSVIIGVADLSQHIAKKIALRTAIFSVLTTVIAVLIGLTLVLLVEPGAAYHVVRDEEEAMEKVSFIDALLDLVRNMIPHNLIQACFQQYKTTRLEFPSYSFKSNSSLKTNVTVVKLVGHYVNGANTLGMIVCAFVFGLILKRMGERAQIIVDFIVSINRVTKFLVDLIMW